MKRLLDSTNGFKGFVAKRSTSVHQQTHSQFSTTSFLTNSAETKAKPYTSIPRPKCSVPYIGTVWHYRLGFPHYSIKDIQKTQRYFYDTLGPLVRETIHGSEVVHVFDLDDIRKVYAAEGKVPLIEPLLDSVRTYRQQRSIPLGVGNMNGEQWYKLRSAVNRYMLRPNAVQQFLNLQQEVITEWIEQLRILRDPSTSIIPNMYQQLSKWNYETASYNVLHSRCHCLADDNPHESEALTMAAINDSMFQYSLNFRFSMFPWLKLVSSTPAWRNFINHEDQFYGTILGKLNLALDSLLAYMETVSPTDQDRERFLFLRYMLMNEHLSRGDILITGQSLFVDGLSTTVPTAAAVLYFLGREPEEQEKLHAEISAIVGPKSTDQVTVEHFAHLPRVRAFLKEVFRFFPIQPGISRVINSDLVLSGYEIPAGTAVLLDYAVHLMDPKHFKDPHQFNTDRWIRSKDGDQRTELQSMHPYLMLPFSHGPRQCLGRRFAEQELHLLITKIIQNFWVQWKGPKEPFKLKYQMLNVPNINPLKVAIIPRITAD